LPTTIKSIGEAAFTYTNISTLSLPGSVTSVGPGFINGMPNLKSIIVNASLSLSFGCYILTQDMTYTVSGMKRYTLLQSTTAVQISPTTSSISNYYYAGCLFTNITIPPSVTSIGLASFENCYNLISITLPDTITKIGTWTFSGCSKLISVTLPTNLKELSGANFYGCGITSINIPTTVTIIGDSTFQSSKIITITIPFGITKIGVNAFYASYSLKNITLPSSVTSIGSYAFGNCLNLNYVSIPSSVTNIDSYAFYNSNKLTCISNWNPNITRSIGNLALPSGTDNPPICGKQNFYYKQKL